MKKIIFSILLISYSILFHQINTIIARESLITSHYVNTSCIVDTNKVSKQIPVIIKFKDECKITIRENIIIDDDNLLSSELKNFLNNGQIERMYKSTTEEDLEKLHNNAEKNLGKKISNPNSYFIYSAIDTNDYNKLANLLLQCNVIAYFMISPQTFTPFPGNYQPSQFYLENGAAGISASTFWTTSNNRGANIKLVDIEFGVNDNHHDFPTINFINTGISNSSNNDHGTAVCGEIVSLDNGWGTTGIASDCFYYFAPTSNNNIGDMCNAIILANNNINPGDFILIEQELVEGPLTNNSCTYNVSGIPVEWNQAVYNAIQLAVGDGKIVIEPAGNGGSNLDDTIYSTGNGGHHPFLPENNSGAIMVGAGASPWISPLISSSVPRSRLCFSNYGSRVDLQGIGENIMTTGGNANEYSSDDDDNYDYTNNFNGTSSASPIVTGAAILVQSKYKQETGNVLSSSTLLNILKNTGKPQQEGEFPISEHIGPLPDVVAAIRTALWAIRADLIVVNQTVSNVNVTAGNIIIVQAVEQNLGSVVAEANVVSIHLSANDVLTPGQNGDTYLGEINFSAVSPQSTSSTNSQTITIPENTLPGSYYLFFSADGGQEVIEADEYNNFATVQIAVGLPNLTKESHNSNFVNNTLTINTTIENNGTALAESSTTQYVLSVNSNFSTIDYEIGSQTIPSIPAGFNSSQSKVIDLTPFNLPAGTYYAGYYIDILEEVTESNESDNGYWSLGSITINGGGGGGPGIIAYEYWFDNNYASNVFQSITPQNNFNLNTDIPTSGLPLGLHSLHIRFKDENESWSSVVSEFFHKTPASTSGANHIVAYEYWFDNDFASHVLQSVSPQQTFVMNTGIDVDALTQGLHTYHIRYKDNSGNWSSVVSEFFHKLPPTASGNRMIVAYEYWFDNDYDSHILQSISPQQTYIHNEGINVNSLTQGLHTYHIRYKDDSGNWSSVVSEFFHKTPASASGTNNIVAYDYWFDNDYASHVLQSVPPQQTFVMDTGIDVDALTQGLHTYHIRYKDNSGNWSSVVSEFFHKLNNSVFPNNLITGYRYWFDLDDAAMVTVELSTPVNQYELIYDINTNSLVDGEHTSHFQFQDVRQSWSSVLTESFLKCSPDPLHITANGPTALCPGNTVTLTCTPSNAYLWSNGATTASITVNTGGDYFVSNTNVCGSFTSNHILVTNVSSVPATPPAPTYVLSCGGGILTRTGTPPAGETWYWQGTSCSTNTNLGQESTYNATSPGTYYIRSQNISTGCWSNECGSVVVAAGCPKPSGTIATNILNSTATISWTALPCATSYEYRYRYLISPGVYSAYTAWFTTGANTVNLTGLTVNTTYQWVVRAICNTNTSAATSSTFTTCTPFIYYADTDGDGYGSPTNTTLNCSTTPPIGYQSNNLDCNDAVASIYPGATELCNGIDDNCDNDVENVAACPPPTGLATTNISASSATISWSSVPCAIKYEYRYRYLISPGVYSSYTAWFPVFTNTANLTGLSPATTYQWIVRSVCNNNVISSAVSSSFTTCVPVIYYADADADGYGNPATSIQGCSATPPVGYQTNSADCNDGVASIYPGAPELCDGIDNDCDGLIEGDEGTVYYQDTDGDGFGNPAMTALSCTTVPEGYVSGATDCNDNLVNTYPGATELCDGVDNNCDNIVDNVSTCPKPTGLAVANIMMTTATISWNVVPCAVNGYQYRLRIKTGSTWSNYGPWIATATNTVNLAGLAPVTTYQYQARTKCYGNNKFSTVVNGPQFTTLGSALLSEGNSSPSGLNPESGYSAIVFPNPNTGKFTIAINSELNDVTMEIVVTDGLGRILQKYYLVLGVGVNQQEVDLSAYPDASYYIELRSEKGNAHYSVVKSE